MLKNYESPKNGDYISYIDELLKQSSLSSSVQNKKDDVVQDFTENFSSDDAFPSKVPEKAHAPTYALPAPEKSTNASRSPPYTAFSFNKNLRKFFFLIFLIVFLGSILAESDGQGAIVLLIIIAIAVLRFMASVFKSTKSNRKK